MFFKKSESFFFRQGTRGIGEGKSDMLFIVKIN